ncbi:hypothetical protein ACFX2K_013581 [Malus domestica]
MSPTRQSAVEPSRSTPKSSSSSSSSKTEKLKSLIESNPSCSKKDLKDKVLKILELDGLGDKEMESEAVSSQHNMDEDYDNDNKDDCYGICISRDSMHKRRATGGKKKAWRKKRKYELGRQPANTKLSSNKTVRRIRVRGGNVKWRALRLDTGNFSWGSEAVTRKTRLLDVVYNASNNELVRTQTLVKSAIVQVDAAPFKQWYLQHYGVEIGRKKKSSAAKKDTPEEGEGTTEEAKKSNHVTRKLEKRQEGRILDPHIEEQFGGGRLLACISSRPGQCGRCDGYILEGKELEFYMKKLQRKKGKGAGAAA